MYIFQESLLKQNGIKRLWWEIQANMHQVNANKKRSIDQAKTQVQILKQEM